MTPAERMRRHRQRRRRHAYVVPVEIGTIELNLLVALGHLSDSDCADPVKVGEALKNSLRVTSRVVHNR